MHYYKRHIGDYAKKAGHLTPLEHGVYNLIIDNYYDREHAPTMAEAIRWARARSEDEQAAVQTVLSEFFTLDGDRYQQSRIEEELELYHGKAEINRKIAVVREQRKRETKRSPEQHEPCTKRSPDKHASSTNGQPNHKPLTTNQEPEEKVKPTVPPSGETGEVFAYWQQVMNHPQAKLDAKREKAIKARFKDGYTVGQLCQAIDGCAKSPHHMGQNDANTVYDDIELICRDASKVDGFIKKAAAQTGISHKLQHQINVLQEWMNEP